MESDEPGLARVVTLPWLVLYGLGSTVGAGIYVLAGVVAGRAGNFAPLAFALAAGVALLTALSFAELSARFPRAGGALVYVKEGLRSNRLSFLVGILSASAGMISAATVSLGFVGYFAEIASLPSGLVLTLAVLGVGGIAAWGVRESVWLAGTITLIEVAGLVAILGFGVVHLLGDHPATASPSLLPQSIAIPASGFGPGSGLAVLSSVVLCFYAYLGFEDMVNVAEEVRDVRRSLPRAIRWTLGLSTILYVSVAAIAVAVVPPAELATHAAPLSFVFERSGGSASLLSAIAVMAMLNGALVQVIMASRILFSLSRAREGPLPAWLGYVHPRRRTPLLATALVATLVGLLAATLPLASLATATASVALATFVLVNVSMCSILLREEPAARHAEGAVPIAVPMLGAISSLGLLGFEVVTRLVSSS